MSIFSRLLVAVDGSPPAGAAIALALRLAGEERGIRLRFTAVIERVRLLAEAATGDAVLGSEEIVEAAEGTARNCLDDALAAARTAGVEAEGALREGEPVEEIVAETGAWNASCVVLGTHGRAGLSRAVLGSCSEGVLRRSPVPVLVTREPREPTAFRRVVCALDETAQAALAFRAALDAARELRATLQLLSIVHLDDAIAEEYERRRFDPEGSVAALYDEPRRRLEAVAAEARTGGVAVDVHVAGADDIAAAIVAVAGDEGADLLVVGTHGRGGIERLVLGSVAEAVIRHSEVPVLAVRTAQREATPGP